MIGLVISLASGSLAGPPSTVIQEPSSLKKFMPSLHEEQLAEAKAGDFDLVMIGDSITHAWSRYPEVFKGVKMLNLGFPGDRTQNVLWRIEQGVLDGLSPKLVTLMIGTNHAHEPREGHTPDTPEDIFTGIRAVVNEVKARLPDAKILVFSVFPREPGPANDRVKAVNAMLPRLADGQQVVHVDINQAFLDEEGNYNSAFYNRDGLHLNPDGYATWAKALAPVLAKEELIMHVPTAAKTTKAIKPETDPDDQVVPIWPEGTPGTDPGIAEEILPNRAGIVRNIYNPNLTVFRPENPNGTAIVICPGGGYGVIAAGHEGKEVAQRLNVAGITAFVLKYRLPSTAGVDFKHPVPVSDALRAIQWVRHHADDYHIDPDRIGIMGFSAGGHLAASAGTLYSKYRFGDDEIARAPSRPDFLCLGYPVISTKKEIAHGCVRSPLKANHSPEEAEEMSCELNVTEETPPAFLFHARSDQGVLPENSIVMYEALKAKGVPAELKLYEQGGHGFGLGRSGEDSEGWMSAFLLWMKSMDIIPE